MSELDSLFDQNGGRDFVGSCCRGTQLISAICLGGD